MSQRSHLPAEMTGLARLFRQSILRADSLYISNVKRIMAPIEARLDRKPILSHRMILDTVRAWRAIETRYRLALDAETGPKRRLTITDWRLAATSANNTAWQSPELEDGVAIVKVVLISSGAKLNLTTPPHSVVSRHALARWFERQSSRDFESLVRDIKALVVTKEPDRVPCESGTWLSSVIVAHDDYGRSFTVRDVRTFLSVDALVDA
jgi:hypothetical protein